MDTDTIILLVLTGCAFCWWFSIRLKEDRLLMEECNRKEQERLERLERVKRLTNRKG